MGKRGENGEHIWLKHIILHAWNSQQKISKEYQHLKVIIRIHIEFKKKKAWRVKLVIEFYRWRNGSRREKIKRSMLSYRNTYIINYKKTDTKSDF